MVTHQAREAAVISHTRLSTTLSVSSAAGYRDFSSSYGGSSSAFPSSSTYPPSSVAPPSVHALHTANSAYALQRCVHHMLGFGDEDTTSNSLSASLDSSNRQLAREEQQEIEEEEEETENKASSSARPAASLSGPASGPQLLTSSVYDLMLSRLCEFDLSSLALRVLSHMRSLRMHPSSHARMSLLKMFAVASRPVKWREALSVWQGALDEFVRSRRVQSAFKPAISPTSMMHFTKLALSALAQGAQPLLALQVLRTLQRVSALLLTTSSSDGAEIRPDTECFVLVIQALCMDPSDSAMLSEADLLLRQALHADIARGSVSPLPSSLFTPLIVGRALAGTVPQALALLSLQAHQSPRLLSSSRLQPALASTGADERTPAPLALIATIVACVERGYEAQAIKLWKQLHQRTDQNETGSGNAGDEFAAPSASALATSEHIPFALRPPSAFLLSGGSDLSRAEVLNEGEEEADAVARAEVRACLAFHFSGLAIRQYRLARAWLWAARQRQGPERADPQAIENALDEFAEAGQTYLLYALLQEIKGMLRVKRQKRGLGGAAASAGGGGGGGGSDISTDLANLFLRCCLVTSPVAQVAQAEVVPRWLRSKGVRPDSRSYLQVLQAHSLVARPRSLWPRSLDLRLTMDQAGEPLRTNHMHTLILTCARACVQQPQRPTSIAALMQSSPPPPLGALPSSIPLGPHRGSLFTSSSSSSSSSSPSAALLAPPAAAVLDAWAALQGLFKLVHPSLATPDMHRMVMCAALHAHQHELALHIFQTQYNADCTRDIATSTEASSPPPSASSSTSATVNDDATVKSRYFRSLLDTATFNHLLWACRCTNNPFLAVQLYQMMLQPDAFSVPRPTTPPAATATFGQPTSSSSSGLRPNSSAPPSSEQQQQQGQSSSGTISVRVLPDFTSHWMVVSWIDELQAMLNATKSAATAAAATAATASVKRKGGKTTHHAAPAAAAPLPVVVAQWLPVQAASVEGPPLRGAAFTTRTLSALPTLAAPIAIADLTSILPTCLRVERTCYASLASPTHGKHARQAIWLPLQSQQGSAARSVSSNSSSVVGSDGAPSPFHIDLLPLSSGPTLLPNAESVLHLSLRHASSLYLETGQLHDLVVVHSRVGPGSSSAAANEDEDDDAEDRDTLRLHAISGNTLSESSVMRALDKYNEPPPAPPAPEPLPSDPAAAARSLRVAVPALESDRSTATAAAPLPAYVRASAAEWWCSARWQFDSIYASELRSSASSTAAATLTPLARLVPSVLTTQYGIPVRAPTTQSGEVCVTKQHMTKWMRGG